MDTNAHGRGARRPRDESPRSVAPPHGSRREIGRGRAQRAPKLWRASRWCGSRALPPAAGSTPPTAGAWTPSSMYLWSMSLQPRDTSPEAWVAELRAWRPMEPSAGARLGGDLGRGERW